MACCVDLEDVVPGKGLGGVPAEGHEVCSDGDGKENDVEDLESGEKCNKNCIGSIVQSQRENEFRNSSQFRVGLQVNSKLIFPY